MSPRVEYEMNYYRSQEGSLEMASRLGEACCRVWAIVHCLAAICRYRHSTNHVGLHISG